MQFHTVSIIIIIIIFMNITCTHTCILYSCELMNFVKYRNKYILMIHDNCYNIRQKEMQFVKFVCYFLVRTVPYFNGTVLDLYGKCRDTVLHQFLPSMLQFLPSVSHCHGKRCRDPWIAVLCKTADTQWCGHQSVVHMVEEEWCMWSCVSKCHCDVFCCILFNVYIYIYIYTISLFTQISGC